MSLTKIARNRYGGDICSATWPIASNATSICEEVTAIWLREVTTLCAQGSTK